MRVPNHKMNTMNKKKSIFNKLLILILASLFSTIIFSACSDDSPTSPPVTPDVTNITIDNEGASAWLITEIDGDGASAELDTENTELTLDEGFRFTITNLGAANHPFELRDADGNVLISAAGDGSLQDDEEINVVVDEQAGTIKFTLTGDLAANVATYNCQPHPDMEGTLTVN